MYIHEQTTTGYVSGDNMELVLCYQQNIWHPSHIKLLNYAHEKVQEIGKNKKIKTNDGYKYGVCVYIYVCIYCYSHCYTISTQSQTGHGHFYTIFTQYNVYKLIHNSRSHTYTTADISQTYGAHQSFGTAYKQQYCIIYVEYSIHCNYLRIIIVHNKLYLIERFTTHC